MSVHADDKRIAAKPPAMIPDLFMTALNVSAILADYFFSKGIAVTVYDIFKSVDVNKSELKAYPQTHVPVSGDIAPRRLRG